MKPDGMPLHRKFGYDHMVEMAAIRAELAGYGMTSTELHFAAVQTYEDRHSNDPSYRERCDARLALPTSARPDPFREALERIRDGHNDPRGLAREILELVANDPA